MANAAKMELVYETADRGALRGRVYRYESGNGYLVQPLTRCEVRGGGWEWRKAPLAAARRFAPHDLDRAKRCANVFAQCMDVPEAARVDEVWEALGRPMDAYAGSEVKTVYLHVRMTELLLERAHAAAAREGRKVSEVVRELLEGYVEGK